MAITDRYVTSSGSATYAASTVEGTPMSLATAIANATAGDRINVKAGTYTLGDTTFAADGTAVSPIIWRGYNSTIGDLVSVRNTNGTLNTTNYPLFAFNSTNRMICTGADHNIFQNIRVTSAINYWTIESSTLQTFLQCSIANSSTGASAALINSVKWAIDCDFTLSGASGTQYAIVLGSGEFSAAINCRFIDAPGKAIEASGTSGAVIGCTFFNDVAGPCIDWTTSNTSAAFLVIGNTFVTSGIAVRRANVNSLRPTIYIDNHVTGCTAAFQSLYDATGQVPLIALFNRLRDNTANFDGFDDWTTAVNIGNVTTDTGGDETDYTDASTDNYRLISGAPGAGVASVLNRDIGSLQRASSASGGLRRVFSGGVF